MATTQDTLDQLSGQLGNLVSETQDLNSEYSDKISAIRGFTNPTAGTFKLNDGTEVPNYVKAMQNFENGYDTRLSNIENMDIIDDTNGKIKSVTQGVPNNYKYSFMVNGDYDTYYPVLVGVVSDGASRDVAGTYTISRHYSNTAPYEWNNSSTHHATLNFQWEASDHNWDAGINIARVIHHSTVYQRTVANFSTGPSMSAGVHVVWLRGGGAVYYLTCPYKMTIHNESEWDKYDNDENKTVRMCGVGQVVILDSIPDDKTSSDTFTIEKYARDDGPQRGNIVCAYKKDQVYDGEWKPFNFLYSNEDNEYALTTRKAYTGGMYKLFS